MSEISTEVPGYQGAAAHTFTTGCDGFHPIGEQCNLAPGEQPGDEYRLTAAEAQRAEQFTAWRQAEVYTDPTGILAEAFTAGWAAHADAEPQPATVIVVNEVVLGGLHERRYTADGIDLEDGALAVTRGTPADGNVVAVYAPGHWAHAREDGATVPGDADELRELLAEVLNDASLSPALAGWIERAQALGVKGWDGDPIGASLSDAIEEQDL